VRAKDEIGEIEDDEHLPHSDHVSQKKYMDLQNMVYYIFYIQALYEVGLRVHGPNHTTRHDVDFRAMTLFDALDQTSVTVKVGGLDLEHTK